MKKRLSTFSWPGGFLGAGLLVLGFWVFAFGGSLSPFQYTSPVQTSVSVPALSAITLTAATKTSITQITAADPPVVTFAVGSTDLLSGWNFTSGWTTYLSTVDSATQFTTSGQFGLVKKSILTAGTRYKLVIAGTVSTGESGLRVQYSDGSNNTNIATSFGTYYFTPTTGRTWFQISSAGAAPSVVNITTLQLYTVTTLGESDRMTLSGFGEVLSAEKNSGTLTVGEYYKISARADGDFTAVGAANNNVGTYFKATAVGTGLLDAGDKVYHVIKVDGNNYTLENFSSSNPTAELKDADFSDAAATLSTGNAVLSSPTNWTAGDGWGVKTDINVEQQLANSSFATVSYSDVYASNFSAGVDGWYQNVGDANLVLTGNVDQDGVEDTLQCNATGGNRVLGIARLNTETTGKYYRFIFDYEADASCGIAYLGLGAGGSRQDNNGVQITEGSWQTSQVLYGYANAATIRLSGFTTQTGSTGDALNSGTDIYFKNINLDEITLDSWTVYGTRSATNYLAYDVTNGRLQIVSDGGDMGVSQSCTNGQTYYYEVDAQSVTGSVLLATGATHATITAAGVTAGYFTSSGSTFYVYSTTASDNVTLNSVKLYKVNSVTAYSDGEQSSTTSLEVDISAKPGNVYVLSYTTAGATTGTLTPQIGGKDGTAVTTENTTNTTTITAGTTGNLKFQASTTWDGTIADSITITPRSGAVIMFNN